MGCTTSKSQDATAPVGLSQGSAVPVGEAPSSQGIDATGTLLKAIQCETKSTTVVAEGHSPAPVAAAEPDAVGQRVFGSEIAPAVALEAVAATAPVKSAPGDEAALATNGTVLDDGATSESKGAGANASSADPEPKDNTAREQTLATAQMDKRDGDSTESQQSQGNASTALNPSATAVDKVPIEVSMNEATDGSVKSENEAAAEVEAGPVSEPVAPPPQQADKKVTSTPQGWSLFGGCCSPTVDDNAGIIIDTASGDTAESS